ncbi:hypothetical protein ACC734_38955, partial [Rhizobium ruizarguesonis]
LFVVIAVSLVVSWVVAVVFTPLIGVTILPKTMKKHAEHKGRFAKVFSSLLQFCCTIDRPAIDPAKRRTVATIVIQRQRRQNCR